MGQKKKTASHHSLNPDRPTQNASFRTKATINRLKMYKSGKPKRNAKGKIIRDAPFQGKVASGTVSRVEPNRKWFGNTKVISQSDLQRFAELAAVKDPAQVMLKQSKLPLTLLQERRSKSAAASQLLEPYDKVFGAKGAQPSRKHIDLRKIGDDFGDLQTAAARKITAYSAGSDSNVVAHPPQQQHQHQQTEGVDATARGSGERAQTSDSIFKAGSSARVWSELYKVVDSSDVLLYVLDARDPQGTRSAHIEAYLEREQKQKHFVFVLNKVDLVPIRVTQAWLRHLSQEFPAVAFHANVQHPFGKMALTNLLRQFKLIHKDRPQISVGVIGFPNVGKSSLINTLRNKNICNVAPIAGETKVWQYVTLFKTIFLIDCPGVVYPRADMTEQDMVLRSVVRNEHLSQPDLYIRGVLDKVRPEFLRTHYRLYVDPDDGDLDDAAVNREETVEQQFWNDDPELFLTRLAKRNGKLLKGSVPDIGTVAKMVLNDFQRGRLPFYHKPPGYEEEHEDMRDFDVADKLMSLNPKDMNELSNADLENAKGEREGVVEHENEEKQDGAAGEGEETSGMQVDKKQIQQKKTKNAPQNINDRKSRKKEESEAPQRRLTSVQRRRIEKERMKKNVGVHFYKQVNIKDKLNRKRNI